MVIQGFELFYASESLSFKISIIETPSTLSKIAFEFRKNDESSSPCGH